MVTALDPNTALVLIDLQKGTFGMPLLDPAEQILRNANQLLAAFHAAGRPVVLVTVDPSTGPSRRPPRIQGSTPQFPSPDWMELHPAIEAAPSDRRIVKFTWNAFYGTDLDAHLRRLGVTGLVLGGIRTCIGVEGTARAAFELGYNLTFAQDAMTDVLASAQDHSLQVIFPRMGEIDTTANILRVLAMHRA